MVFRRDIHQEVTEFFCRIESFMFIKVHRRVYTKSLLIKHKRRVTRGEKEKEYKFGDLSPQLYSYRRWTRMCDFIPPPSLPNPSPSDQPIFESIFRPNEDSSFAHNLLRVSFPSHIMLMLCFPISPLQKLIISYTTYEFLFGV